MTNPEYAPLLGHAVPAGCRQLAEHELLQKGDLYLDTEQDPNRPNGVKLDPIPEHWAGDPVDDWTYLGAFFRKV